MKPVYMKWGKKNGKYRHEPLIFIDAETGTSLPKRYSTGDFSGKSLINAFMNANNAFVEAAMKQGIGINEETYARFFQLGIRYSAQIEGKFKDLTEDAYIESRLQLENEIISGLQAKLFSAKSEQLEDMLGHAQLLNEEDAERLKDYVAQISKLPFKANDREGFDSIISALERGYEDWTRVYAGFGGMASELKADYLLAAYLPLLKGLKHTYIDTNSLIDTLRRMETDDLRKKYLKALMLGVEERDKRYDDAYQEMNRAKEDKSPGAWPARIEKQRALSKIIHPVDYAVQLEDVAKQLDYEQRATFLELMVAGQNPKLLLLPGEAERITRQLYGQINAVTASAINAIESGNFFETFGISR